MIEDDASEGRERRGSELSESERDEERSARSQGSANECMPKDQVLWPEKRL